MEAATIVSIIGAVFAGLISLVTAATAAYVAVKTAGLTTKVTDQGTAIVNQGTKLKEIADTTEGVHKAVNSNLDKARAESERLLAEVKTVRDEQKEMHSTILRLTTDNAQLKEQRQGDAVAAARAEIPRPVEAPHPAETTGVTLPAQASETFDVVAVKTGTKPKE